MDKSQRKQIGKAIRYLRIIHELDAKILAKKIGYSRCYQLNIESGAIAPSDNVINKWSKYFKIPADDLLDIGDCHTLIDAFKYLQIMQRI